MCVGVWDVSYFNSKGGCEFILESDTAADLPRTSLLSHHHPLRRQGPPPLVWAAKFRSE
jgi:hypothetical protein